MAKPLSSLHYTLSVTSFPSFLPANRQPNYLEPTVPPTGHGRKLSNKIALVYVQTTFSHHFLYLRLVNCVGNFSSIANHIHPHSLSHQKQPQHHTHRFKSHPHTALPIPLYHPISSFPTTQALLCLLEFMGNSKISYVLKVFSTLLLPLYSKWNLSFLQLWVFTANSKCSPFLLPKHSCFLGSSARSPEVVYFPMCQSIDFIVTSHLSLKILMPDPLSLSPRVLLSRFLGDFKVIEKILAITSPLRLLMFSPPMILSCTSIQPLALMVILQMLPLLITVSPSWYQFQAPYTPTTTSHLSISL